ncbi:hypothetical protein [Cellulosimicrobium sp. SH8]|uniref:hypothetical protein n=1 Tax=Cellulosimicrobium sp. SH8 TaxID=2952936 RepID=UPI0021F288FF|nr:hypothetical protein [Cellulosimicrobium sp. SH8]
MMRAAAILAGASAALFASPVTTGWSDIADEDRVVVRYETEVPNGGAEYVPAAADGGPASEAYRRVPAYRCYDGDHATTFPGLVAACPDGQNAAGFDPGCTPDQVAMEPLFRQTWTNTDEGTRTAVSAWELVADASCVGAADLAGEAEAAFRTLTIAPSPVIVQPPDGWTLVNVPTITYTQPGEQTLDTTLLGIPVQIRATPRTYAWDYGDGTAPLSTTDPGAAYPHHTVAHTYDQPAEQVQITLTTTWSGQFRLTGTTTWTDVTGTATTTSTADPLRVYEARSRLVTDDLDD